MTKTTGTLPKSIMKTAVLFLVAALLVSCGEKRESGSSESDSTSAASAVKPPETDIHTAVITENIEVLKKHVEAGSNLNEPDPFGGSSPLITAAVFGKTSMAKILIDAGADLNFQNKDGSTALHSAAFFCRPEIVKMLLEKGADKTIKNKYNATAYESVALPFSEMKEAYDMMGTVLGPMGLKLDYPYIEKTRPEIAAMLK
jgi:hypothetical protein